MPVSRSLDAWLPICLQTGAGVCQTKAGLAQSSLRYSLNSFHLIAFITAFLPRRHRFLFCFVFVFLCARLVSNPWSSCPFPLSL